MRTYLILILLTFKLTHSQKTYVFDYLHEYELTFYKDSKSINNSVEDKVFKRFLLTNSKDNNYIALLIEIDSLTFRMEFSDRKEAIFYSTNILKSIVTKMNVFNIAIEDITGNNYPYKYKIKEYDFINIKDTLINNRTYYRYNLTSILPKIRKRKKRMTEYFIIDKNTSYHLPILLHHTDYEEWKSKKNIPNGIYIEKYYADFYGRLKSKEKLIKSTSIEKKISIN